MNSNRRGKSTEPLKSRWDVATVFWRKNMDERAGLYKWCLDPAHLSS